MPTNKIIPDFTEDLVGFMIQMMLTIARFPKAPFALIPMSKVEERIFGADAKIESIAPLYLQFKRSFAYPSESRARLITERKRLKLRTHPRVFYFELRAKDNTHKDYQHNILFDLRQKLVNAGVGEAVYTGPLFLNRSAYLLAVHVSSIVHWRPWNLFRPKPFFRREFDLVTSSGSIRFQNCPVIKEHIVIPPHARVTTHLHKYSYLENGQEVCFHSPSLIERSTLLGQFLYDFLKFSEGIPTTNMIDFYESIGFLNDLSSDIFDYTYNIQGNDSPFARIDAWLDFGEKLKVTYDIDQYFLIRYSTEF